MCIRRRGDEALLHVGEWFMGQRFVFDVDQLLLASKGMESPKLGRCSSVQSWLDNQPVDTGEQQVPCAVPSNLPVLQVLRVHSKQSPVTRSNATLNRYNRVIDLLGKAACSCGTSDERCSAEENILVGVARACSYSSFELSVRFIPTNVFPLQGCRLTSPY